MNRIGILAYGSLIEDPGDEIAPLIQRIIRNVETPFNIEFSRKSSSRDDAPTVIPVEHGGAPVNATILVLTGDVGIEKAMDLVWRRETRNETSDKHYKRPLSPSVNQVVVDKVNSFHGIETVLFIKIGANIPNPNPNLLAKLAVSSTKAEAGKSGKDGISYLISLKRQKITTPLMPEYEKQILAISGTQSLEEAYDVVCKSV